MVTGKWQRVKATPVLWATVLCVTNYSSETRDWVVDSSMIKSVSDLTLVEFPYLAQCE